jgi:hypothetical protein
MMQRSLRSRHIAQRGAVIPLFVIGLAMLLSAAGLALEFGHLLLLSHKLQRSVDLTLMQSPMLNVASELSLGGGGNQVQSALEKTLLANLRGAGLRRWPVNHTITADQADTVIQATFNRAWWFARLIFGLSPTRPLNAATALTVPRLNIAVVVDTSLTMGYNDPNYTGAPQRKLETVKDAIRDMGEWLRPDTDRVALIEFDNDARVAVPFMNDYGGAPLGGFDTALLTAKVTALRAGGWTNIQDGLRVAGNTFSAITSPAPEEMFLVALFTDGRTTHARIRVPTGGSPAHPLEDNPSSGQKEYYLFVAQAKDSATAGFKTLKDDGYMLRKSPLLGAPPWESQKPACESGTPTNPIIKTCFGALTFQVLTADGTGTFSFPWTASDMGETIRRVAYLTAASEADLLRTKDISVYSVGVGITPTGYAGFIPDPFWGTSYTDFSGVFLRRLSMDFDGASDPAFPPGAPLVPPLSSAGPSQYSAKYYRAMGVLQSPTDALRKAMGKVRMRVLY